MKGAEARRSALKGVEARFETSVEERQRAPSNGELRILGESSLLIEKPAKHVEARDIRQQHFSCWDGHEEGQEFAGRRGAVLPWRMAGH